MNPLIYGPSYDVPVTGHQVLDQPRPCGHDVARVTIMLRQIGWIDQKGIIYPAAIDSVV